MKKSFCITTSKYIEISTLLDIDAQLSTLKETQPKDDWAVLQLPNDRVVIVALNESEIKEQRVPDAGNHRDTPLEVTRKVMVATPTLPDQNRRS